ncbi:MAG: recombinase RecT, partial [Candidatus Zixiibacteriota bacterium]
MAEQEKSIVEYKSRDGQMIKLSPAVIKKYLVSGNPDMVTPQELYLYMGICKSRGLNPFIRDCYLIKYTPKDPAAIVVSIDYYRKRARAQTDCQGWKAGITLIDTEGNIVRREGCLLLHDETLVGAWFEALPTGWSVPMKKEINLERYIKKTREGNVTRFWSKDNQPEQVAKVVESQGLRATWPDEFQGLYVDAERESMEAQAELGDTVGKDEKEEKTDAKEKLKEKLGKPEEAKKVTELMEEESPPPEEPVPEPV